MGCLKHAAAPAKLAERQSMNIIGQSGDIVQRSRNLRGLITRAGKVGVDSVSVHRVNNGASCYVVFKDGSYCRPTFADFTIARDFFRARWRKWGMYAETRCSDNQWNFS
jgi:hypothetical protein